MWGTCAVVAWCAMAALLASAATAARLDLWPTSTGPAHGLNESQTYRAGEERIGWDLPSYGMVRVAAGAAEGYYFTAVYDKRDGVSGYLRAEENEKLSMVYECTYNTLLDAYLMLGVPFKYGTDTDMGWGQNWSISVHGALFPNDTLSNGELRPVVHYDGGDAVLWRFAEHADGGFTMQLVHKSSKPGEDLRGPYLSIPEDVEARDDHSRFVSVTEDVSKAARVTVELP